MTIENSISKKIPGTVKLAFLKAPADQQQVFVSEFRKKSWNPFVYFILALLGLHFLFMGRIGLTIIYWLTFCGFGFWYLFELFNIFKRVKHHNEDVAASIMRDIKIMDQQHHSTTVNVHNQR